MNTQSLITEKLIAWGKINVEIRSLILTGSRAIEGKRMQDWVAEETWSRLQACFARFDPEDCWQALNQTMIFFRDLSMQTAALLKFSYPQDLDDSISTLTFKSRLRIWA